MLISICVFLEPLDHLITIISIAKRAGCDGTPTGLGVDEFLGEIHPKILEVSYCVDDSLCFISHLPQSKRPPPSDRASVAMENLQMATLVLASARNRMALEPKSTMQAQGVSCSVRSESKRVSRRW